MKAMLIAAYALAVSMILTLATPVSAQTCESLFNSRARNIDLGGKWSALSVRSNSRLQIRPGSVAEFSRPIDGVADLVIRETKPKAIDLTQPKNLRLAEEVEDEILAQYGRIERSYARIDRTTRSIEKELAKYHELLAASGLSEAEVTDTLSAFFGFFYLDALRAKSPVETSAIVGSQKSRQSPDGRGLGLAPARYLVQFNGRQYEVSLAPFIGKRSFMSLHLSSDPRMFQVIDVATGQLIRIPAIDLEVFLRTGLIPSESVTAKDLLKIFRLI